MTNSINSITFSFPREKIVDSIPKKTKILSNLVPGRLETYIYNNETDYYNEYKQSMFAITIKKGGWDCMRHYEILANGCIPYFPNIENCPEKTMALLPKQLIREGNLLYNKIKNKNIGNNIKNLTNEDIKEYNILVTSLLEYTKNNLTTEKVAKYILEKTSFDNVSKILYLSGDTNPDYLRCLILHGFKTLLGNRCHDYPKIPHIYKTNSINYRNLYGKGITYSNMLDSILHDEQLDTKIENDIKKKYYDIIIFGSYHRGMPYYELINKIYKPNEIILLCGEDIHQCDYEKWLEKGHTIFVREL